MIQKRAQATAHCVVEKVNLRHTRVPISQLSTSITEPPSDFRIKHNTIPGADRPLSALLDSGSNPALDYSNWSKRLKYFSVLVFSAPWVLLQEVKGLANRKPLLRYSSINHL